MESDGLLAKPSRILRAYCLTTTTPVRIHGEESLELGIHSGMRRGCPLSLVLYTYAVDKTQRAERLPRRPA